MPFLSIIRTTIYPTSCSLPVTPDCASTNLVTAGKLRTSSRNRLPERPGPSLVTSRNTVACNR